MQISSKINNKTIKKRVKSNAFKQILLKKKNRD